MAPAPTSYGLCQQQRRSFADNLFIFLADDAKVAAFIRQRQQQTADDGQPRPTLVIGQHHRPRSGLAVCRLDHLIASQRIIVPACDARYIHGGEFPVLQQAVATVVESLKLRFLSDVEPELEEVNALGPHHLFEARGFFQKVLMLLGRAKAHHGFDARSVVPGAVEGNEFARSRKMLHIALEIPLAALSFGGLGQCYGAGRARVHILMQHEYGAALARGITAFEQGNDALSRFLHPGLRLHQLDLKRLQLRLVFLLFHFLVIGVTACSQLVLIDPFRQLRIVDVEQTLFPVHVYFQWLRSGCHSGVIGVFHAGEPFVCRRSC